MNTVLVGIPTLNGSHRLHRCLASIIECTEFHRHPHLKLVVCDDGSNDEQLGHNRHVVQQLSILRDRAGLELIEHGDRRGIAKSWNSLTKHGGTVRDITVLLNDDVEVVPHWLDALVYTLRHNPHAGMVGLNSYVSLTKQAFTAIHPNEPAHVRMPRIDYCEAKMLDGGGSLVSTQGCAFGFTREAFEAIDGFDERFFCFNEEVDFGIRLRKLGRPNYMLSYPIIFHEGGATTTDINNMNAAYHMNESRRLFHEKWGKSLGEIREEFIREPLPPVRLNEWNTQIHNWQ